MKKILESYSTHILLVASLMASFPLLFGNALKYSFPMGYAGLFTQMAKQIADANFQLPVSSPFYGPGGIPFAYPPFGLYLLAILIKITGKYFVFLRLLPPLLSWIAFIPLFYLVLGFSKSSLAAAITVVLAATSKDLYIAHVWAAGIVRAPAFIFTLTSLYFFFRQINDRSRLNLALAGFFLGLAFMSHLMYGLFCVIWIGWWTLVHQGRSFWTKIKDSVVIFIVGIFIASIWLTPILLRYGILILLNAFDSHGGTGFLSFGQSIAGLVNSFIVHIDPIRSNPILSMLALLGLVVLLLKREYVMVSFSLIIILIFPESERFVFLLGCIIAAFGLSAFIDWVHLRLPGYLNILVPAIVSVLILGAIWWNGYETFLQYSPLLGNATLDLANYIRLNTPSNTRYLALVKQDEAEWMPFLFQREPFISQWGSEWLGTYDKQTYLMSRFNDCRLSKDWQCVEGVFGDSRGYPDVIVAYTKDRKMNDELLSTQQWKEVYLNKYYVVWELAH